FALPTWGWLVLMLCIAPVFFTLLLENNWSGYVLAIVCVFAAHLLLVDDDPGLLKLLGMRLTSEGYSVVTAESGQEGLRVLHR
ncbi:hypothetical protein KU617_23270, partial [Salmonella enterica subsp. enterica serovar Montevideo]|nr:hypothetical protein [Salmonella enterica subsp. enterica serovar Montevideo]